MMDKIKKAINSEHKVIVLVILTKAIAFVGPSRIIICGQRHCLTAKALLKQLLCSDT
jgi:hypothetical protein